MVIGIDAPLRIRRDVPARPARLSMAGRSLVGDRGVRAGGSACVLIVFDTTPGASSYVVLCFLKCRRNELSGSRVGQHLLELVKNVRRGKPEYASDTVEVVSAEQ